jgi:hypothetical protein
MVSSLRIIGFQAFQLPACEFRSALLDTLVSLQEAVVFFFTIQQSANPLRSGLTVSIQLFILALSC